MFRCNTRQHLMGFVADMIEAVVLYDSEFVICGKIVFHILITQVWLAVVSPG